MDEIQFKLGEYVDAKTLFFIRYIDVYINNRRLIDMVYQVENRHFGRQRSRDFCGYVGLHIAEMPFQNNAFPGIFPDSMERSEFWGTVLTCTCGIDLCSSIVARVEILGDFLLWHEVMNPWLGTLHAELMDDEEFENYDPCDYSAIGPYVFRRKQYVDAWYAFKRWIMDWKGWNQFNVYTRRFFP